MIVVCGVRFMGEMVKILSPGKKVLIPDIRGTCPLADMINEKELINLKKNYPGAHVLCYINSPANIKALSDICVTSENSIRTVKSISNGRKIIFVPDRYLAEYVKTKTGADIISWNGYCPVHLAISAKNIIALKKEQLDADVLAHPECSPDVINLADEVLSTGQMLKFVKKSSKKKFIIATELGILYRLKKENPDKVFFEVSKNAFCKEMRLVTLEKILKSLEDEKYSINLPAEIIRKAKLSLQKMNPGLS